MDESNYIGCIVGLAVGDALGYPAEFRRRTQLIKEIGPAGIEDFIAFKDSRFTRPFFMGSPNHPPGTYTDDTQMTMAVAEALLAAGDFELDELAAKMSKKFVEWSRSLKNNRAPGGTCMEGCANLAAGVTWREAGVAESKGCGSVMRVAPIGLYYADVNQIAEVARSSSLLTHGHSAALEGAAAAAILVGLARRGAAPEEMFAEVDKRCSPRCADFSSVWRKLPDVISQPAEAVLVEGGLGEAWVAEEAVASAMYCFWRFPDDFERAVLTAINTDGDSDTIGTITGSLVGARLGVDSIPAGWRKDVEDSEYLHALGSRLWNARNKDT
jgi:ADP-ribosylglycohydrolase